MYQGEFSFMNNGEKYVVGEVLVNRTNFKQGTVVRIIEDDENNQTDAVSLQYEDGSTEWVSTSGVSRLLLETDPKPNSTNLNEDPKAYWNL
jgi:hypothetical protein